MEVFVGTGAACPVGAQKVDASSARVNGVLTTGLLAVALFTPARRVLALLVVDFAVKVFVGFRYSPLSAVSRALAGMMRLSTHPIDAAPKRFAAGLGLAFSSAGIVLGIAYPLPVAYYVVVGMFTVCAALEGFAGFCVGCTVYQLLFRWRQTD